MSMSKTWNRPSNWAAATWWTSKLAGSVPVAKRRLPPGFGWACAVEAGFGWACVVGASVGAGRTGASVADGGVGRLGLHAAITLRPAPDARSFRAARRLSVGRAVVPIVICI